MCARSTLDATPLLRPATTWTGQTAQAAVVSTRSPRVSPVKTAIEDPANDAGFRPACSIASTTFPSSCCCDRSRLACIIPKNSASNRRRRQGTHPTGTPTAREPLAQGRNSRRRPSGFGRNLRPSHHRTATTPQFVGRVDPQVGRHPIPITATGVTRDSILFQPRLSSTVLPDDISEFSHRNETAAVPLSQLLSNPEPTRSRHKDKCYTTPRPPR